MKTILYIGNNLKSKTSNISSIQLLGGLLEVEGYRVYYASAKRNKVFRLLDMVFSFLRYQHKVDYVFIDTYSTHNFYFALVISQLCRLFRVKYIPNLNGGNLPVRLRKHPKMCRMIFNHAYCNVSPSNYLKEAFEQFGYNNVTYIPNTIELKNYKCRTQNYNSIKLLWVRSFSKIYNPVLAVKVLKELTNKDYDASLCMVGPDSDGSLEKVKEHAKKVKLEVIFTGKLPKKEWISLAKDYNVFINTTNFDNTPVSVIEAMALGLPVVSTNVGGLPYLIEDNKDGLLVEPNNTEAMVNAIIRLYQDENFAQTIAKKARQRVKQFDWQVVKNKWNELLN